MRKLSIYISLILLFISSCAIHAETPTYNIEKIVNFMALGTGSTTGTYFPLGSAFANIWTQKSKKNNVLAHSSSGSYENIELLKNHEISIAIAQNDIVTEAINGTGKFQGKAYPDLRILMALYPEVIQFIVPEKSDIKTIEDLKGHRINIGPEKSGNALTAIEVLKALNISENDFTACNLSYDESIQAMEKEECDASVIIAGIPTKAIIEVHKRIKIRILEIPLPTVVDTVSKLPYLSAFTITDDIYGDGKQTSTLAVMALLITDKKLEDEKAYELVKILFDNLDYLKVIHERARDISIKNSLRGVNLEYTHPGSLKFLKEEQSKQ